MRNQHQINWDGVGIFTSILCAIHCTIVPLAAGLLPLVGLSFLKRPLFEYGMIALAFGIGTWALWHGFTHHHRRLTPWLLFAAGMIVLIVKEVWSAYELYFLPFAVVLILSAHILNYRLIKRDSLSLRSLSGLTPPQTE